MAALSERTDQKKSSGAYRTPANPDDERSKPDARREKPTGGQRGTERDKVL